MTMRTTPAFRLTLSIFLLPTLLLGLYLGHLTVAPDKALENTPQVQIELTSAPGTFNHFGTRWHRVTQELADSLAEGSAPDATTRIWENCAIRIPNAGDFNRRSFVICPDGVIERW